MRTTALFLIAFSLAVTASAGPVPAPPDAPITHVGLVAPDVIGVTFRCGKVEYGAQTPYTAQPGDRVDTGKDLWVFRGGKCIGALVGKERKLLWHPDRLVGEPFCSDWASAASYHVAIGRSTVDTPVALYRKSKAADLARTGPWEFRSPTEDVVYLRLPRPVAPGEAFSITCGGSRPWRRSLTFDPARIRSEAVHVSQVGFRPDDPAKPAFLSCWMGDGGAQSYDALPAFRVVADADGKTLLRGRVRLGKAASQKDEDAYGNNHNLVNVYEMDMAALRAPGRYRVVVEGIGCSHPFVVAPDAWRKAFIVSARGFYHQRSGIALGPPYTAFRRPRTFHPADGLRVTESATGIMDTGNGLASEGSNFGNLVKGATDRPVANAWGGTMDAGDWDRRIQHLDASRLLLELVDQFPATFGALGLNIPESGKGLPDAAAEALFNVDCYRRLQTPDGGIRGGIESEEHPRQGEASWQESLRVYAYAPCVWSSYLYAGVAARAARVVAPHKPELAKAYRESALRAMAWAERELPSRADKKDPHAVRDARNLAAAELFRLTGEARWHDLFLQTTAFNRPDAELNVWQDHDQSDAAWVYLRTDRPGMRADIRANCRAALLREADQRVAQGKRTAFHWTGNPYRPFSWGLFSAPDGVTLARAHALTADPRYLVALVLACQPGAGANPSNLCYTTGAGVRSPEHPLHIDSRITHQPPPPGLTVGGPRDVVRDKDGWEHKLLAPVTVPPPARWPNAEAYFDVFWYPSMCEFTIHSPMAQNAYTWGYLAARR
jgi:endoglucanase